MGQSSLKLCSNFVLHNCLRNLNLLATISKRLKLHWKLSKLRMKTVAQFILNRRMTNNSSLISQLDKFRLTPLKIMKAMKVGRIAILKFCTNKTNVNICLIKNTYKSRIMRRRVKRSPSLMEAQISRRIAVMSSRRQVQSSIQKSKLLRINRTRIIIFIPSNNRTMILDLATININENKTFCQQILKTTLSRKNRMITKK